MSTPKITLSAGISPTEGSIGTYLITLDAPAPAGGLAVNFNTTGSTATLGADYNFTAGENLAGVTGDSFSIVAGATTATLNLAAIADAVIDPNETVMVNLLEGAGYDLASANALLAQQTTVAVGSYPNAITTADFDGDGNADLAIANQGDKSISVRLGDGSGGFTGNTPVAVSGNPVSITSADFNHDGKVDLSISNANPSSVSILLNYGKNGFTSNFGFQPTNNHWSAPVSITTADFNGDGNADLATANESDGTVSVRLGDGSGGFTGNATVAVGGNPYSVVSTDFNGDGNADLATANIYGDTVSVRLGNGRGGFIGHTTIAVGREPSSITTVDFNGDGNADLAIANSLSNTVSVCLGSGSGSFTTATSFVVGNSPWSISTADFNGDGNVDLATANYLSDNVSMLLGNGSGSFASDTNFSVGDGPKSITAADFNGDGKVDLATANNLSHNVSVWLNTSNTTNTKLTITDIAPPVNQPPLGTVTISDNTPEQNQILTATNTLTDADGLGTITYSWSANGLSIGTGNNYTVTANEVGKSLAVTASYTDGLGKVESVGSASTNAVTAPITAGFAINPITPQSTGENGTTASYSIQLNTAPLVNQDVTVNFTSSDTSEGVIDNPTFTFTSTNYNIPQTLTIQGVDDYLNDGDVPYQVTAKVATIDVFYKALIIDPLSLTNTDDGLDIALDLYGDVGGSKIDVLNGGTGADKLHGLNMADNLSGGLGNDSLWGGYGDDNLFGNEGDDKLLGEQENDYLDGGSGNDTLDGGDGQDTMMGGVGNDTYYLGYDAIDVITDNGLKTDIDTVIMPYQLTHYTLPLGIEQGAIAAGTQASSLSGNGGNNSLTGNDGKNSLSGAVGRDSLFGGLGDDVLNGGTGKDNLTGGAGKDVFLFDAALKANIDKITDFKPIDDTIQLDHAVFTKLGATGVLSSDYFIKAVAAIDPNDYIIYNPETGAVSYDADGNGSGVGVQIALLGVNLALTNEDFVIM